ncbi:MAG: hypothetical protein IT186_24820 [Acidobacteria bacterium]|nr:hypothetical protein [Acidobacteriota bacterium]MCG3193367.1 hypothetical protein [Thermoanaerobaculia bacterium]MCK6682180.1 hypothetical protein [Thermoanaerobaculia bacterium]
MWAVAAGESPVSFTSDGRALYVARLGEPSADLSLLDLATRSRRLVHRFSAPDGSWVQSLLVARDTGVVAYGYQLSQSDVYFIRGVH